MYWASRLNRSDGTGKGWIRIIGWDRSGKDHHSREIEW